MLIRAPRFTFYVSPACEVCADAEAHVEQLDTRYARILVMPSERPGFVRLTAAGIGSRGIEVEKSEVPATPMLIDSEANPEKVYIGFDAIEAAVNAVLAEREEQPCSRP